MVSLVGASLGGEMCDILLSELKIFLELLQFDLEELILDRQLPPQVFLLGELPIHVQIRLTNDFERESRRFKGVGKL